MDRMFDVKSILENLEYTIPQRLANNLETQPHVR